MTSLESPKIKSELIQHLNDEKGRISMLQSAIVGLGGQPTQQRLVIPPINPRTPEAILALNRELEKQAIKDYANAAASLEGLIEHASLKAFLEQIAREEASDVQDMDGLAGNGENS